MNQKPGVRIPCGVNPVVLGSVVLMRAAGVGVDAVLLLWKAGKEAAVVHGCTFACAVQGSRVRWQGVQVRH